MLQHTYRSCQPDDIENNMCFEVLGFDIFLDESLKPWIIEVNHDPSYETDSPLDFKVKKQLVGDALRMLNLNYFRRIKYKRWKQQQVTQRSLKGKNQMSRDEKDRLKDQAALKREL